MQNEYFCSHQFSPCCWRLVFSERLQSCLIYIYRSMHDCFMQVRCTCMCVCAFGERRYDPILISVRCIIIVVVTTGHFVLIVL